jgi:predicted dehydrogenase
MALSRRSFLEHTLFTATAGLAAASAAYGAQDPDKAAAAEAKPTPPGERIRLAVIGCHSKGRGMAHLDGYTYDDRVEIAAVCDVDQSHFAAAQEKLKARGRPAAQTYQDIRKLLEDKSIHAVSIATPNHWHALAAIWAMQAGKDVYVEKPVSHNISEGRRLEQARVKYNRICQAGTQSRSNKATQEAIKYIHEGGIGKVSLARGLCYKRRKSIGHFEDSQVPPGVAYDIWLGPAPQRPFNKNRFIYEWHWNWDYGNGDLGNQGVHQMDIARWALKRDLPVGGIGLGGRFSYVDDGQTPNTELTLCDYGDVKLLFEVRGLETKPFVHGGKIDKPEKTEEKSGKSKGKEGSGNGVMVGDIIYGSEGFVAIGSDYGTAVAYDKSGKLVKKFKGSGSHFRNYIDAVVSRKQEELNCPIVQGHYSALACHIGNVSYRLGDKESLKSPPKILAEEMDLAEAFKRYEDHLVANQVMLGETSQQVGPKLVFDPKTETFGDNAKANAFLTRDYRAPFVVPETL